MIFTEFEVTVPNEPYEVDGQIIEATVSVFESEEEARAFIADLDSTEGVELFQSVIELTPLDI